MENTCKNCVFAKALLVEFTNTSLKAQNDIKKAVTKIKEQDEVSKAARLKAIEEVITSEPYKEHIKVYGAFSMSKKKTDINGVYLNCSNKDQLVDENTNEQLNRTVKRKPYIRDKKEGIIHKYYFSCLHFEGK